MSSFLLAAQSMGVAAIAQAAVANYSGFLKQRQGIAADRNVVCGISFGHEDRENVANAFRTSRENIANVVDWIG